MASKAQKKAKQAAEQAARDLAAKKAKEALEAKAAAEKAAAEKIRQGRIDAANAKTASYRAPKTVAGGMFNQGMGGLVDMGNKWRDNPSVAGFVAGKLGDSFATQANMGLALEYNNAYLGSLSNYQMGMENLKTGNTMKLMAAEGGISRDLMKLQGQEDRLGYETQGAQARLGYETQGAQARLLSETEGRERRKDKEEDTNQTLRLRFDARGAISNQGGRFFG